jgi:uncharacterized membrane protein YcjF (UPF0283 family)
VEASNIHEFEIPYLTFLRLAGVVLVHVYFSFDSEVGETRVKKVLSDANRISLSFFCVF